MEVHHHTHHGKKKWTEYIWEFLMLFLAVFCGFLAEYQLEHKIEKDREKQFMISLVEDLKADTAMLAGNIKARQERVQMIDTFFTLLYSSAQRRGDVYYLARRISPPTNIFPNDGTIQQLKSSGNLRLVTNKEIANSIMAYDQKVRKALFEMGDESAMRSTLREHVVKVFDSRVFIEMTKGDVITKPTGNPAFLSNDPNLINELSGDVLYLKRIHYGQLITSAQLLKQADSLMQKIKIEYHLR